MMPIQFRLRELVLPSHLDNLSLRTRSEKFAILKRNYAEEFPIEIGAKIMKLKSCLSKHHKLIRTTSPSTESLRPQSPVGQKFKRHCGAQKIAAIEFDVGVNELLPELTFLFNTYVSSLRGGSDVETALTDQFTNTPGYSVGLEFEVPIGNRAARNQLAQRELRKVKIKAEVEESIQQVIAESQIADRNLRVAQTTLAAARTTVEAAKLELIKNEKRWEAFALVEGDITEGLAPSNALDQLLDSQERLADAEYFYAKTEVEIKLAEVELQRAMGTLVQHRELNGLAIPEATKTISGF